MVRASEIIMREIREKGYNSGLEFCEKNGIDYVSFMICVEKNSWTSKRLEKIGDILSVNLKSFANAKVGRGKNSV